MTFPLSFGQERLWFLTTLDEDATPYNVPVGLRLRGRLDLSALERSLEEILRRHDVLRTRFPVVDGRPVQLVSEPRPFKLPVRDLGGLLESMREPELARLASEEATRPFNLTEGPLLRGQVLRVSDDDNVLLLTVHHIVFDGWSSGVLFRELSTLYEGFSAGRPSPLTEPPIQYADYALWQKEWLQGELLQEELAYWKTQLAGAPAVLELPTDKPRPARQSFHGALDSISFPARLRADVKELSRREGVTLYMTLLAVFDVLLHRYTSREDIVVGAPVAGRNRVETEALIGFFVNTLVLRTNLSGDPTFRELLRRVREVTLGAFAHQDLPFERLVEELNPERDSSHNPLFQVAFVLQNAPGGALALSGLTAVPYEREHTTSKFDLTLAMAERGEELAVAIEYNTDLFERPTIERMLGHLGTLLAAAVADPECRLSRLPMLTSAEQELLSVEWNATARDYPRDSCVHELFEAQAARTPEAVALEFEGQTLSYRELNRRSNQLAHRLRALGVGPEVLVGLCVDRSLEMVVGLLGILKAGGAYLPLDPGYPRERLAFMLKDTRASVILTESKQGKRLPGHQARVVLLDAEADSLRAESTENPVNASSAKNLAYVMYTSGSTGRPKGTLVPHRGVVRLVQGADYARLRPEEVFLQFAPISFDAATFEIWGSLLNGARLVVSPPGTPTLKDLARVIRRHRVSTLWLTAGVFHLMVEEHLEELSEVAQLLAGGDVLSAPHVEKLLQVPGKGRLINGYGPTESTTFACVHPMERDGKVASPIPIGRPIANTQVYVLDRHYNSAPVGVPGELYIGGDGLARGYWERPGLTAERFVPHPFSRERGGRLYRTGDLARYRADGTLDFLGRVDNQVKIRGFRVELGEIESALAQYPDVQETVVVAREGRAGDKRLVAYIVLREDQRPPVTELRAFLKKSLPDYMIPSFFVPMDALPLNPNGKVDRQALPVPEASRADPEKRFVAPRDELELQLAKIWGSVLNVEAVGIQDNFFDLGGHSLLAVRLFSEIEKATGRNLPLATLFEAPTVEQLAAILRQDGWKPTWSALVPIQPAGSKPPFFCMHASGGNVVCYYDLARRLGPDQPVYGLQALGLDGEPTNPEHGYAERDKTQLQKMARRYLKEMRQLQPEGPYYLGGTSYGGIMAFEIAQQLLAQGQQVGVLALFDTWGPDYPRRIPGRTRLQEHVSRFVERIDLHLGNFLIAEGVRGKLAYISTKGQLIPDRILKLVQRNIRRLRRRMRERAVPETLRKVEETTRRAHQHYVPQYYPGRIHLFRALKQPSGIYPDPELGWTRVAGGGVEVYEVPGYHGAIIYEPRVHLLAERLSLCMEKAHRDYLEKRSVPHASVAALRLPAEGSAVPAAAS